MSARGSATRRRARPAPDPPICAAGRSLLRSALALLSWLICAMASWLCVPAVEDPEGGADQNGGEDEEDAGLDALECPEAAGRLIGH
jgi:hypothetical protein